MTELQGDSTPVDTTPFKAPPTAKEWLMRFRTQKPLQGELDTETLQKALEHAISFRETELNNLWERAKFMWLLQSAAILGLVYITRSLSNGDSVPSTAYAVAGLGFIISLISFFVTKTSKFWHNHWEHIIDVLEDGCLGPLYKTLMIDLVPNKRCSKPDTLQQLFGARRTSFLNLLQFVNIAFVGFWVFIIAKDIFPVLYFLLVELDDFPIVVAAWGYTVLLVLVLFAIFWKAIPHVFVSRDKKQEKTGKLVVVRNYDFILKEKIEEGQGDSQ